MDSYKYLRVIVIILAILITVIGLVGFSKGLIYSYDTQSQNLSLPLGEPRGIVVDTTGRIYVGAHFYTKVLVYSRYGKYEGCLNFDASGGDFRIIIDNDNMVSIATVRNKMLYQFNKDKMIISAIPDNNAYKEFGEINEYQFTDKQDIVFKLSNKFSFPSVIKQTPSGNETTIVSTSFYEWIFLGPFPAWLFVVFGIIVILSSSGLLKKEAVQKFL